jgi:hypothetical protein
MTSIETCKSKVNDMIESLKKDDNYQTLLKSYSKTKDKERVANFIQGQIFHLLEELKESKEFSDSYGDYFDHYQMHEEDDGREFGISLCGKSGYPTLDVIAGLNEEDFNKAYEGYTILIDAGYDFNCNIFEDTYDSVDMEFFDNFDNEYDESFILLGVC